MGILLKILSEKARDETDGILGGRNIVNKSNKYSTINSIIKTEHDCLKLNFLLRLQSTIVFRILVANISNT